LYVALKEGGKEDCLDDLGSVVANYVDYVKGCIRDIAADKMDKEQFMKEAHTGKLSIRFQELGEDEEGEVPKFAFEEGICYMQTPIENWNQSVYYFGYVDQLRKQMGLLDPMTLVQRRNLREANTKIEGYLKEMNKEWANKQLPLTWEDPSEDLYKALKEGEKLDQLDTLGSQIANYVDYFKGAMNDISKDKNDKEQFLKEAHTAKFTLRFQELGEDEEGEVPKFAFEEGVLYMQTPLENWNQSVYYFGYVDQLRKQMGLLEPMVHITFKNKIPVIEKIDKGMKVLSKLIGKDFYWVHNNFQELHDGLMAKDEKAKTDMTDLPGQLVNYYDYFESMMKDFVTDKDNLEAFLEPFANFQYPYVGVRLSPDEEQEDSCCYQIDTTQGVLWMNVKDWNSSVYYMGYKDRLEKLL